MRLVFVRHGQTTHNVTDTVQGHTDTELTDRGAAEARELGEQIRNRFEVDAAYASDLTRATRTAELLKLDVSVRTDARLRELDFGDVTGGVLDEFHASNPEYDPSLAELPWRRYPGGESQAAVYDRVRDALTEIVHEHTPDDTVIVVAHHTPTAAALAFVRGEGVESTNAVAVPNCGGFIAEYEDFHWTLSQCPAFAENDPQTDL